MEDELKPKSSKAVDLEPRFEEILSDLAVQMRHLQQGAGPGITESQFLTFAAPDLDKAKKALLDAVSETTMMDPH